MTHSAFGPTVSMEEAQRIENETAEHLLKSRKLSLIVDLDQTIVHATVDPTVGEWIMEGGAWEARQLKKSSTTPKDHGSDSSDEETLDADVCNPNWDALKDVHKFRLGPESFGLPSSRGSSKVKGNHKVIESEGCMYYIKPRCVMYLHENSSSAYSHICIGRACRTSSVTCPLSTRCMCIPWVPAHMRKRFVLPLILMEECSGVGS